MLKEYHVIDASKATNTIVSSETIIYSLDVTVCIEKLWNLHCTQCIYMFVIILIINSDCINSVTFNGT